MNDADRRILQFEERVWAHDGAKVTAILETFGWSPVQYYMHLIRVIALPEAVAEFPMLVKRTQRLIRERTQARADGRLIESATHSATPLE